MVFAVSFLEEEVTSAGSLQRVDFCSKLVKFSVEYRLLLL